MKLLNFGSLNIDHVYTMDHFVEGKETQAAETYERYVSGKGLNQSVALAAAGQKVYHAGKIGADGTMLRDFLYAHGVDTSFVQMSACPSGHAVIQVAHGENAIIVFGGANQDVDETMIDAVLEHFSVGDLLLAQNEISSLDHLLTKAAAKGMKIALNPSPIDERLQRAPLALCDLLLVNEVEAAALSECDSSDHEKVLLALADRFPKAQIVMTCGGEGAWSHVRGETMHQPAFSVPVVDTTCAGDTFTGFYLSALLRGHSPASALRIACKAASFSIQRAGAAPSIPTWEEVVTEERKETDDSGNF